MDAESDDRAFADRVSRIVVLVWYGLVGLISYSLVVVETLEPGRLPQFPEMMRWWLMVLMTFYVTPPILLSTGGYARPTAEPTGQRARASGFGWSLLPFILFALCLAPVVPLGVELLHSVSWPPPYHRYRLDDEFYTFHMFFLEFAHPLRVVPPIVQPVVLIGSAAMSSSLCLWYRSRGRLVGSALGRSLSVTAVVFPILNAVATFAECGFGGSGFFSWFFIPIVLERIALPYVLLRSAFRRGTEGERKGSTLDSGFRERPGSHLCI